MNKLLVLIFLLPLFVIGQSTKPPTKADLTKIYCQAIADFIKDANKKNKTNFDTLFFGKHVDGEPDDFPDIELPQTIEKTQIRLITPEVGAIKQKELKSRIYINMFGWEITRQKAEFSFIVFSNGFDHQYDYNLKYKYNTKQKVFELEKLQFTGQPFVK